MTRATDLAPAPLVEIPAARMPPGGVARFVTARDGARLRIATWPLQRARASVIVLPGRTEFIEKYVEVIGELLERRYAVGILDWRGQGLSDRPLADPLKGHIDSFQTYTQDFREIAGGPFAVLPRPWLLLCHSMGGNIGAQILREPAAPALGAVFSVPMFGLLTPGFAYPLARLIVAAGCSAGLQDQLIPGGTRLSIAEEKFAANVVTHDAHRFARTQAFVAAEPGLALGSPTLGWLNAAFASIQALGRPGVPESITTPSLVFTADQEEIADRRRIAGLALRMPRARLVELHARHELLMEEDVVRAAFWREYDAFATGLLGAGGRHDLRR